MRLSEVCDRFSQVTFMDPMEGYIRRMLWAAAAEGAIPAGSLRRSLGSGPSAGGAPRRRANGGACPLAWSMTSSASSASCRRDVAGHIREAYGVDLTARYLGHSLPHPIGKGSGQLSLNQDQLETDRAAGLAFVVLKTVIARGCRGRAVHGRLGHSRDQDAGGAPRSRSAESRVDGHLERPGVGSLVRRVSRPGARGQRPHPRRRDGRGALGEAASAAARRAVPRPTNIATPSARSPRPGALGRCRSRRTSHRRWPATSWPTSGRRSCAGSARCRPGFARRPATYRCGSRSS